MDNKTEPTLTPGVNISKEDYDNIKGLHKKLYAAVAEYYEENGNTTIEVMIEALCTTICNVALYHANPQFPEDSIYKALSKIYKFQKEAFAAKGIGN